MPPASTIVITQSPGPPPGYHPAQSNNMIGVTSTGRRIYDPKKCRLDARQKAMREQVEQLKQGNFEYEHRRATCSCDTMDDTRIRRD
jgi:hypothetical protein